MPRTVRVQPAASEAETLWQPSVATVDTGTIKVLISLASGNLEFQDEQGHRLLQEFQDAPRRYVKTTVNGEEPLLRQRPVLSRSAGSHLRPRPAPERHVQLSRLVDRARAGQHRHHHPAHGFHQWLRPILEHRRGILVRQPLSVRDPLFLERLARHRLLLPLRPRVRPDHPSVPRDDRPCPDVRRVGLRILAVERPLQERRRSAPHREGIPRRQSSHRQHRAGLVLVGAPGRS